MSLGSSLTTFYYLAKGCQLLTSVWLFFYASSLFACLALSLSICALSVLDFTLLLFLNDDNQKEKKPIIQTNTNNSWSASARRAFARTRNRTNREEVIAPRRQIQGKLINLAEIVDVEEEQMYRDELKRQRDRSSSSTGISFQGQSNQRNYLRYILDRHLSRMTRSRWKALLSLLLECLLVIFFFTLVYLDVWPSLPQITKEPAKNSNTTNDRGVLETADGEMTTASLVCFVTFITMCALSFGSKVAIQVFLIQTERKTKQAIHTLVTLT